MNRTRRLVVILAAGQGTRMKSAVPKVLHPVGARPMIAWSLDVGAALEGEIVVVLGHGRAEVEPAVRALAPSARIAVQAEQRGTGDAVAAGLRDVGAFDGEVVILYADCPLVPAAAMDALARLRVERGVPLAMLTTTPPDPAAYGRILRDRAGRVIGVREHKDASPEERAIREINPGMYVVDARFLAGALPRLETNNAQGELYLTDVVALAAAEGGVADMAWQVEDLLGVNDRAELAAADARIRLRINTEHARRGVTIRSLTTTFIDPTVHIEPDAVIEPHVVLRGATSVGAGARIDVGCVLEDVSVAAGALLRPYTVAARSSIGEAAQIGPFTHIRPDSEIGPEVQLGNFVETKKTRMARAAKAHHLAYLGDGVIGERVNIGAGTIFCNYDGFQKHVTTLEDGVFIGSDSQLIAPITIGRDAYVATGTTVTRDVPRDGLAIARTKQENKEGYAPRLRARLAAAAAEAKQKKA